ncbi:MAG: NrsF family protein [Acidobacteriota bacterium]
MPEHDQSLDALRRRLAADVAPVRPLRPARWLAAALAVFALAGVTYFGAYYALGFRADRPALGPFGFWGLSALQMAVALALLGLALRESVPGRRPSLALLWTGVGVGLVAHIGIFAATYRLSPVETPMKADVGGLALYCFLYEMKLGLPVLVLALWLASRGLATRPTRLAVLVGVGAALAGDALWRLVCPLSDPDHILRAHTPSLLAAGGVALLITWGWDRLRLARS